MLEPPFLSATRAGYNAIATAYTQHFEGVLEGDPWARAVLTAFAELVGDTGPVADIGSGPGRVAAFLSAAGVRVHGIDLSPAMVEMARRSFPDIRFDEGSMTALDIADHSLAGALAWYSLIHIPPAERAAVLAEFHRVLRPGAPLLLAFQAGRDVSHHDEGFGHAISLDFHRLVPEEIEDLLEGVGFTVDARLGRRARGEEPTPQAYLLATRSS
ncbi:class I SAM-dependent methyltransferase [Nocardia sp. NBC_00416]|uniref:class I SAM-dependent methyltransferase n=1 Tax=Nocardia sp. NBC_00416 TaxID=2975991 RepID=UPI002E20E55E